MKLVKNCCKLHFIQETDCENVYSVCSNERINAASENFCSQLISNLKQFGLNQVQQNDGPDLNSNYLILIQ